MRGVRIIANGICYDEEDYFILEIPLKNGEKTKVFILLDTYDCGGYQGVELVNRDEFDEFSDWLKEKDLSEADYQGLLKADTMTLIELCEEFDEWRRDAWLENSNS